MQGFNFIFRNCIKLLAILLLSFISCIFTSSIIWAQNYYVDASNGNDKKAGTESQPWASIDKANSVLKAGDTVYIKAGQYKGQQIRPNNSGTANNRITYSNYKSDTVYITDTELPINLNNRSYITIDGLNFKDTDYYLRMEDGDYNYIRNCKFSGYRNYKQWIGFWVGVDSSYNRIQNNIMHDYGRYIYSDDNGDMVYIGAIPCGSNSHNLIEGNHFYHGGHGVLVVNSPYNVIRNNYIHNEEWYNGYGSRTIEVRADGHGKWNLFEENRIAHTGISNDVDYASGVQLTSNNNIFRRNLFYNCKGPGIKVETNSVHPSPYGDSNYIYHNVLYHNGYYDGAETSGKESGIRIFGDIQGTRIKNNIFYDNKRYNVAEQSGATNTIKAGNFDGSDPLFIDAVVAKLNPSKRNYPDFNLKSNSPCIDSGVFLTRTTESRSGTKIIPVEDAHYFMDGWSIIEPDTIQLANNKTKLKITRVDYDANLLYVDTSISFKSNQGISLEYSGSSPDIGAVEKLSTLPPPSKFRVNGS